MSSNKSQLIKSLQTTERSLFQEIHECKNKNIGFGFIYCDNAETAQTLINSEIAGITLKPAPCDYDIIWQNMTHHKALGFFKWLCSNLVFVILFLVLFTPFTLSSLISVLLKDLEIQIDIISKSLSSVVLSLFQYILVPYVIRILANQEIHSLKSELASSRIFKYLLFSIMNIIIFPLIGSVTLTVFVQKMIKIEILEWNVALTRNISTVGDLFLNFIISMAFVSNVLDLMAFSSYFINKVSEWQASTFHEEQKAAMAPEFDFAYEYAKVLTIFAVTLVFSISTPLILVFGVIYMVLKYCIDKYNLLFAYRVNNAEVLTTQKTVISCLFVISALFQSINSGLFIVSGNSVLIWLGGILTALSLFTLLSGVLIHKYWHLLSAFNLSHFWRLKYDFANRYQHPCESIISEFANKI